MKKRTLLRSIILLSCALLLVIGGNAKALDQLILYLPIVVDGTSASPSQTTQPPSTTEPPTVTTQPPTTEPPTTEPPTTEPPTTEPPPSTTEPPPSTTEPPPATTEPPPQTTEPPPATTEPPPQTTEPPPATTEPPNNPPDEPSNPTPADGATEQFYEVDLSWIGGDPDGDNVTFDVYLEVYDETPDVLVSDDQSTTSYDPGPLSVGGHYFWQIIVTDEHGLSTSGPVWDFEIAPPAVSGNIIITDIFYNGEGSSEPNEYVEIRNDDYYSPIDLGSGWTLSDEANHVFHLFGIIYPDQICRIYTNEYHPEWCGFNLESGSAIWDNDGDTAYLRDDVGTLIDEYSYP